MQDLSPSSSSKKASIGVVGLGVMGRNLARNLARNGSCVAIYNRSAWRVDDFMNNYAQEGEFIPSKSISEFVQSLQTPRVVLIMVKAGDATDVVINELVPLMNSGDIIIDGGNTYFKDTIRREAELSQHNIEFIGMGVSGGEEGALHGPSLMVGGSQEAWQVVKPLLENIAAKAKDQSPCVAYIGPNGAGHFVKMVHNGIEYADMQLIGEVYNILSQGLLLSTDEIADIFEKWNQGDLNSYLIEITAHILRHKDQKTGKPFIQIVDDAAGMKGTGTWTAMTALEIGEAVPTITEAVFARALSSEKELRHTVLNADLPGPKNHFTVDSTDTVDDVNSTVEDLSQALFASKIIAYAQGLREIATASALYKWNIDMGEVARIWRNGCIIRAQFLDTITKVYQDYKNEDEELSSLLIAPYFKKALGDSQTAWRSIIAKSLLTGLPIPVMSSALSYYDELRASSLPTAVIQAQRDFFGAHTYHRVDEEGVFHTHWEKDIPTEEKIDQE